jgi:outer membrane murein-binding lipoprotein Lpp
MLDPSKILRAVSAAIGVLLVAGCATQPEEPAQPAPPVATAPATPPPKVDDSAQRMEAARALLAQAETDVQRARSRHALWTKAWEDLIAARNAASSKDPDAVMRYSRDANSWPIRP